VSDVTLSVADAGLGHLVLRGRAEHRTRLQESQTSRPRLRFLRPGHSLHHLITVRIARSSLATRCQFHQQYTTAFSYKSALWLLCSFSLITVWLCIIFWRKTIGTKIACKMLMKLTKYVNFTNNLQATFFHTKVETLL